MAISFKQHLNLADEKMLASYQHVLVVLPLKKMEKIPYGDALSAKLKRINKKYEDLSKGAVTVELSVGALVSFVAWDAKLTTFKRQTLLRKAIKPVLDEAPQTLAIAIYGDEKSREQAAKDAFYVASVNAQDLPQRKGAKNKEKSRPLKTLELFGWKDKADFADIQALVEGNTLT